MIEGDAMALRIQLLGPVRALRGDAELGLGGPRRRTVLAMLAMRAGHAVSRNELIDGLWGPAPTPSAANAVHVYVAGLRQVLEPQRASREPGQVLAGGGPGYRLRLEPGALDTEMLSRHLAAARRLASDGDLAAAGRSLESALGLWQGASLAGIPGPWADVERARIDELRRSAVADRVDILLELGGHHQALPELTALIRQYPLHERFHAQLMLALYRCGRQADALAAFADARRELVEQLGIDPGPELRRLHQQILAADTALDAPPERSEVALRPASAPAPVPGTPRQPPPVPRELPAGVDRFTSRAAELDELDALLRARDSADRTAVISVLTGSGGVGKTALAVHWGHRGRDEFPGGQLYVNLRGYDPAEPVTTADALAGLLRSLGTADADIPAGVDERAAAYRSLLDGRRVLVVLDNAATVEQVRPLLPGTPSSVVLVTSRDTLAGLVARHGARRLDVGLLPPGDAVMLLRELIGARVDADPVAAATMAGQCARLPLALRVAAELAAARPDLSLAELVGELADEQRRLDLLDAGGDPRTAVRAVFSWSYRHLPADAARAFGLIGLHPGPDLDALAAAALTGTTAERAGDLLLLLTRGNLVQRAGPGRYAMHDLLRAYAAQTASAVSATHCQAALTRLLDYYLAAVAAAMNTMVPAEQAHRPDVAVPATPLPAMPDPAAARSWLDAERAVLVAMAGHAASQGWPGHATRLSALLWRYLGTGHYWDALTVHSHACQAASQTGDLRGEAYAQNYLGIVHGRLGRYPSAFDCLDRALALFRETRDRLGEGLALINLSSIHRRQGRYPDAAAHAERALDLLARLGDRLGEAHALNSLGLVSWRQGRYQQAAGLFRRARVLYRDAGDRSNEGHALGNLGMIEGRLGRYPQAVDYLRQALALFRGLGYRTGEATTLTDLGSVACRLGRHAEACGYQEEALALFREIGERSGESEALNGLGEVLLARDEPWQSRERHAEALALACQIGDKHEEARARNGLGAAALACGEPAQAYDHYAAALALADRIGDENGHVSALAGLKASTVPWAGPAPAAER